MFVLISCLLDEFVLSCWIWVAPFVIPGLLDDVVLSCWVWFSSFGGLVAPSGEATLSETEMETEAIQVLNYFALISLLTHR